LSYRGKQDRRFPHYMVLGKPKNTDSRDPSAHPIYTLHSTSEIPPP